MSTNLNPKLYSGVHFPITILVPMKILRRNGDRKWRSVEVLLEFCLFVVVLVSNKTVRSKSEEQQWWRSTLIVCLGLGFMWHKNKRNVRRALNSGRREYHYITSCSSGSFVVYSVSLIFMECPLTLRWKHACKTSNGFLQFTGQENVKEEWKVALLTWVRISSCWTMCSSVPLKAGEVPDRSSCMTVTSGSTCSSSTASSRSITSVKMVVKPALVLGRSLGSVILVVCLPAS